MQMIYEENFIVRNSEVDMYNKLKLKSLFEYIQEAAATHANMLGVGMEEMRSHNLIWVLSRVHVKLEQQVAVGTKIRLKTYPKEREKLFFRREFALVNCLDNSIIAYGSSYWLVVDMLKNRPSRNLYFDISRLENISLPKFLDYDNNLVDLRACENIMYQKEFVVNYSLIDINQHLNNANYAMLVEDLLYDCIGEKFVINDIQIAFNIAQKLNEKIFLTAQLLEDKFKVIGKNSNDKVIFESSGNLTICS